jgi:uncharacterized protein
MKRLFAAFLIALAASFGAAPGCAQDATSQNGAPLNQILTMEIPEAKLKLAAKLIELTGTARLFDELLPNIADSAKNNFIRANPQMQLGIISIVDKVAVQLVSRRPELDEYLARVWASGFSEDELQGLIDFYGTDLGKKYAVALPQLLAVQTAAAQEWAKSVAQELNDRVQAELRAAMQAESQALQSDVAGPAEKPAQ